MATFLGKDGVIEVGGNAVAEIRSYSIDETMDTVESTAMGATSREYKVGLKSFSGSADVYFDDTDTTGQGALTVGTSASIEIGFEGGTTGDHSLSGTILVTGRTITGSFDGMVEATISFTGTGALTEGTFA